MMLMMLLLTLIGAAVCVPTNGRSRRPEQLCATSGRPRAQHLLLPRLVDTRRLRRRQRRRPDLSAGRRRRRLPLAAPERRLTCLRGRLARRRRRRQPPTRPLRRAQRPPLALRGAYEARVARRRPLLGCVRSHSVRGGAASRAPLGLSSRCLSQSLSSSRRRTPHNHSPRPIVSIPISFPLSLSVSFSRTQLALVRRLRNANPKRTTQQTAANARASHARNLSASRSVRPLARSPRHCVCVCRSLAPAHCRPQRTQRADAPPHRFGRRATASARTCARRRRQTAPQMSTQTCDFAQAAARPLFGADSDARAKRANLSLVGKVCSSPVRRKLCSRLCSVSNTARLLCD